MEPEVSLVGYKLLPGQPVTIKGKEDSDSCIWTVHITQFALADDPKPGRNVVRVAKSDGPSYVLGTLIKDHCEQFTADFMIRENVTLVVTGQSEVHLTGYLTTTELLVPDALDDIVDTESDEEEGRARALENAENALEGKEFSDAELTEGTSDNEEDAELTDEEDEDEEEDDEDDEDAGIDEEELNNAILEASVKPHAKLKEKDQAKVDQIVLQMMQKRKGKSKAELEAEEDDDDGDMDDMLDSEEGSSSDDDGFSEEEDPEDTSSSDEDLEPEPIQLLPKKKSTAKRTSELADKPEKKKVKLDAPGKPQARLDKATGPQAAKKGPSASPGSAEDPWAELIAAHIRKEGPLNLSAVGSNVKRPPGSTKKLKRVVTESDRLHLDENDVISLQ